MRRHPLEGQLNHTEKNMPFTINAFNHGEWVQHNLMDYCDFAEQITECNTGEDSFSGFGEWFFVPDEPLPSGERVVYFGSWGNDNSPGASSYTNAEIFDSTEDDEFQRRVKHWEGQPEYVEVEDEDEPNDDLLAQRELEDFEQADEYFGNYGGDEF
jgi:hypothetical protein